MGNQWYLDGISIPNATSQFYKATRSGFYQVKIILRNCESPISDIANIILVSNQNESKEVVSRIFPNPSQDFINLVVSSNITTVKICNLQGTLKKKIQYRGTFILEKCIFMAKVLMPTLHWQSRT